MSDEIECRVTEDIKIELLSSQPELVPVLASWAYEEWHKRNGIDFTCVLNDYLSRARPGKFPLCWIAFYRSEPVGMVSLKKYDLFHRSDLFPWLSALYVTEQYRSMGIGSALIEKVLYTAKQRHYRQIYLFTDRTNTDFLTRFYLKRNWHLFDTSTDMQGYKINVLEYYL